MPNGLTYNDILVFQIYGFPKTAPRKMLRWCCFFRTVERDMISPIVMTFGNSSSSKWPSRKIPSSSFAARRGDFSANSFKNKISK